GGETNIEGIPSDNDKAKYGGNDPNDNSGFLRYVSVRHGGAVLQANDEINGITLGGVGKGTVIDYVEVIANDDDGIEWFGGTVDVKHAVVTACKDDAMDTDDGWNGRVQFGLVLQSDDVADNAGEHDGGSAATKENFGAPVFVNMTYIGSGQENNGKDGLKNGHALHFKEKAGGGYYNSIFTDFANHAIEVEDIPSAEGFDAYENLQDGTLTVGTNIWWNFGVGGNNINEFIKITSGGDDIDASDLVDHLINEGNQITDPLLRGISRFPDGGLDPTLKGGSPAITGARELEDPWFEKVDYIGGFDNENWAEGWTATDAYGFFGNLRSISTETITDEDLVAGGTYNWTSDTEYIIDGYVFLEEDGKLNIERGTVIRGKAVPTNIDDNASALIIGRGAQICAIGNENNPIIFTAEDDDLNTSDDLTAQDRGEWGGLIILGAAPINNEGGETNIEGIPSDNDKAKYGGTDVDDNSGELRYVSVRHGGAVLQANDEINGITLGGVGKGTKINYVEVFANDDDGIEWFGGTVDVKNAVVAFCKDDAMDTDDGWNGRVQFGFVLQGDDSADNGGEHDGGGAATLDNFGAPVFVNCTYIGSGQENNGKDGLKNGHALHFKEKAGGGYYNSIFTDYANHAIEVEDIPSAEGFDAYENLQNGRLTVANNYWWNFGVGGNDINGFIKITSGGDDVDASDLIAHLVDQGNQIADPQLGGISRVPNGGLDPRLSADSPARTGAADVGDDWFEKVDYHGAFGNENWATGWTATDAYGYFGDIASSIQDPVTGATLVDVEIFPNPARDYATIVLNLEERTDVNIRIFDMQGRLLTNVVENQRLPQGKYAYQLDLNAYANGV
ncbi:MAG: T9SS type A sorting domain-containing protein, partial [Bacteroidota bacterium]